MFFYQSILILYIWYINVADTEVSYSFEYSINNNDTITQHQETRKNDLTHGFYSFLQPDGLVRFVEYRVHGRKGFRASVKYRNPGIKFEGHLMYPRDFRTPIQLQDPVYHGKL